MLHHDVSLRNALLSDGSTVDVEIDAERIHSVTPSAGRGGPGLDLSGHLLLAAFAEPHAHLDKALTADAVANPAGDLAGAITAWQAHRVTIPEDDYIRRATQAAEIGLANGCTAIRTHVDVGGDIGTRGVEALVNVREAMADRVDIQLVGLTAGLTGPGAADNRAALRAAIEAGLDAVGGVPHIEHDPAAAIDLTLELAAEHGRPVDLHADENLDPVSADLETLSRRVLATGFEHAVTASHCVALGMKPSAEQCRIAELAAEAGVSVVTLPQTNLYLQARHVAVGPPRGLTALAALGDASVLTAAGGDNLRDPFCPVGRGDPLETASLLVMAGHLRIGEALRLIGERARAVMDLEPITVEPGSPADLVAIPATTEAEAVAAGPGGRIVIRRGRVVSGPPAR